MLRELRAGVVCVVAAATCGAPASALEWRNTRGVSVVAQSESNIALSPTDPRDAQNATVAVSADVLARQPGLSFWLQPELRAQRYEDDAQADRNDAFAALGLDLDQRRQRFVLDTRYSRESTLTSELEAGGLLGRLDIQREQRGADAKYSRRLRGQHELGFAVSDVETRYDDSPDSTYGDYGVRSLALTHVAVTNERVSRNIVARKSFVSQSATTRETATTELSATWSRRLSPHAQGTVGVGAFQVERPNGQREDPSGSVSLMLSRSWPRWNFSASAARSLRAETGGIVVVEDHVGLGAERRFGERIGVGLQLRETRTSSAVDGPFDFVRTYSHAGATLSWQLARRVGLGASVYERTEHTTLTRRANSLAGFVSLTYRSG